MLVTISKAAASPTVNSTMNLPVTSSVRAIGASSSVSSVPPSFSPAPRSMAGYIAAIRHTNSRIYGRKPPISAPVRSRWLAVECSSSFTGLSTNASCGGLRLKLVSAFSRNAPLYFSITALTRLRVMSPESALLKCSSMAACWLEPMVSSKRAGRFSASLMRSSAMAALTSSTLASFTSRKLGSRANSSATAGAFCAPKMA